jgi:hypothetical protein
MSIPNSVVAAVDSHIFNDRRLAERRRSFKGALLSFNGGYGALECVVKNFSERGARLSFGEATAVPPRFDLRIGPDGGWRRASVKWRKAGEIGIAYETQ